MAAVCSTSHLRFNEQVGAYLQNQGCGLLHSEELAEKMQWCRNNGMSGEVVELVHQVDASHPVALGKPRLVATPEQAPAEPQDYLTITEHCFPPLPDQSNLPFWDKEWITPELKQHLFGQPHEQERLHTYLILDASQRKQITKVFDLDSPGSDVPIQCLFKGKAAEELKKSAPYLVDMTLPQGAWEDNDKVPDFHKDFFTKHWRYHTGIFIRTPALFGEVWQHFRKFTKATMEEDGKVVFFRFYDPRILIEYCQGIRQDVGKVRCFCTNDSDITWQLFAETGPGQPASILPDSGALAEHPRPGFVLSYAYFSSYQQTLKQKRLARMAARIQQDFAEELADYRLEELTAFAIKITERFNAYGFTNQAYLHYFVVWSLFFNEGFETHDDTGILLSLCQSSAPEEERFNRFKARFDTFTWIKELTDA